MPKRAAPTVASGALQVHSHSEGPVGRTALGRTTGVLIGRQNPRAGDWRSLAQEVFAGQRAPGHPAGPGVAVLERDAALGVAVQDVGSQITPR